MLVRSIITKCFGRPVSKVSNKYKAATVILTKGYTNIKNEKLMANTFNNHLSDITKILKLKKHPNFESVSVPLHKICENTCFH